jgi:hypothetical protein
VEKALEEAQDTYISNGEIFKAGYLNTREAKRVRTFGFVAPEGDDCLTSGYTRYHSGSMDPLNGIYYIK